MPNNHTITKDYNNLRGVSTDNIYQRPPFVADIARNLMRQPNRALSPRRGFQAQSSAIGGLGTTSFKNNFTPTELPVVLHVDGNLYIQSQKFINIYNTGFQLTTVNGNQVAVNTVLVNDASTFLVGGYIEFFDNTGASQIRTISAIVGNNITFTGPPVTVNDTSIVNGLYVMDISVFVDTAPSNSSLGWSFEPWSFTPFGSPTGQNIEIDIDKRNVTEFNGSQTGVSTIIGSNEYWTYNVYSNSMIQVNNALVFQDVTNTTYTLTVIQLIGTNQVVLNGPQLTVSNNQPITVLFNMLFNTGIEQDFPPLISDFIAQLTGVNGLLGVTQSVGGEQNHPAAFIQIFENQIVEPNALIQVPYEYWTKLNNTGNPPFLGSAVIANQNASNFQIASFANLQNCLYGVNGYDFPQKFDGQTVYRTGMPNGEDPSLAASVGAGNLSGAYQYFVTYQQIDAAGNLIEGPASDIEKITGLANKKVEVTVKNIQASSGFNTHSAVKDANPLGAAYGPDSNGFYYFLVPVSSNSFAIGDTAFYLDRQAAIANGTQSNVSTISVDIGHVVKPLDVVSFGNFKRPVREVTVGSITVEVTSAEGNVSINDDDPIADNVTSKVFGDIAIVSGAQTNVNTINVDAGHTVQINDIATFTDTSGVFQYRQVTGIAAGSITISGKPVSVADDILIQTLTMRSSQFSIQRTSNQVPGINSNDIFSNNLAINIYRSLTNPIDGNETFYLIGTIPNDGVSGNPTQVYEDNLSDTEAQFLFKYENLLDPPEAPPVAKYILPYRNILLYAGGSRATGVDNDTIYFSEPDNPESVPLATNFFKVSADTDDVTGLGVADSTLVIFKENQIYPVSGDIITGQYEVFPISPNKNVGCIAHATIKSVGSRLFFVHTSGLYSMTASQFFPIDPYGNPVPLSKPIDVIFRVIPFLPNEKIVFTQAVAENYVKERQYLLFLPCQDPGSTLNVANDNSRVWCYDYDHKDWFEWDNINAAGGFVVINDDLFWSQRRFSSLLGNTSDFYKMHRFYRLIDYVDHTNAQNIEWRSSWEDVGYPNVRKKYIRAVLEFDRLDEVDQFNNPEFTFMSFRDRIPNLIDTLSTVSQVDNVSSGWSLAPWDFSPWSGYQDSFIRVNLRQGTAHKAVQIGFKLNQINTSFYFIGFQLEIAPDFRKTIVR